MSVPAVEGEGGRFAIADDFVEAGIVAIERNTTIATDGEIPSDLDLGGRSVAERLDQAEVEDMLAKAIGAEQKRAAMPRGLTLFVAGGATLAFLGVYLLWEDFIAPLFRTGR